MLSSILLMQTVIVGHRTGTSSLSSTSSEAAGLKVGPKLVLTLPSVTAHKKCSARSKTVKGKTDSTAKANVNRHNSSITSGSKSQKPSANADLLTSANTPSAVSTTGSGSAAMILVSSDDESISQQLSAATDLKEVDCSYEAMSDSYKSESASSLIGVSDSMHK